MIFNNLDLIFSERYTFLPNLIFLAIHPHKLTSIHLTTHLNTHSLIHPFIYPSTHSSTCLSIYPSTIHLSVHPSTYSHTHTFITLPTYPIKCPRNILSASEGPDLLIDELIRLVHVCKPLGSGEF